MAAAEVDTVRGKPGLVRSPCLRAMAQRQRMAAPYWPWCFHYGTARAGKACAPHRRSALGDQPASGGSSRAD